MFPKAINVDKNGVAVPVLPMLPSRYDLAKLDAVIHEELLLANPRQGGGDFGIAPRIIKVVVGMLHKFCGGGAKAAGLEERERVRVDEPQPQHGGRHGALIIVNGRDSAILFLILTFLPPACCRNERQSSLAAFLQNAP